MGSGFISKYYFHGGERTGYQQEDTLPEKLPREGALRKEKPAGTGGSNEQGDVHGIKANY